ncbi:6-phosphogluconolactonase [Candidatus Margulisiibacteriota bacterium]
MLNNLFLKLSELIRKKAIKQIQKKGFFTLVLAGGNTPKEFYKYLAEKYASDTFWQKTCIFFGDERFVPIDSELSNYKMANEALLSKIPIPKMNIFRVKTELNSPDSAAKNYENIIISFFKEKNIHNFDFVLLGLGLDGHTASLFPNSAVLDEKKRLTSAVPAPEMEPKVPRITLTYPALNSAENIFFLIIGKEKEAVFKKVQINSGPNSIYPAGRISGKQKYA